MSAAPTREQVRALVVEATEHLFSDAVAVLGSHRFNDPVNWKDEEELRQAQDTLTRILVRSYERARRDGR